MCDYDSPIKIITGETMRTLEDMIITEVMRVGIYIDKDKLIQALDLDKERYEEAYRKGYQNGYKKREDEIVKCIDCKHHEYVIGCKKWHDVCTGGDDWFCADGERKE